jgi:hypothetical protein
LVVYSYHGNNQRWNEQKHRGISITDSVRIMASVCTCDEPELQQLRVDLLCAGQRVVLVQWWPPRGCPTSQQIQTHNIQAAGGANPGCKDCTHRWSPSWRGPRRECRRARSARTYDRTESMHSNLKMAGIRSNTNRQPEAVAVSKSSAAAHSALLPRHTQRKRAPDGPTAREGRSLCQHY